MRVWRKGSRAGFRNQCLRAWRFDSSHSYQFSPETVMTTLFTQGAKWTEDQIVPPGPMSDRERVLVTLENYTGRPRYFLEMLNMWFGADLTREYGSILFASMRD